MATTKKTANNESKKASKASKSQNTKAAEKAAAQERKPLIYAKRYTDKTDNGKCYWTVTFEKQAFYFYTPNKAVRYMLLLKRNNGGEIFNKDYKAISADVDKIRKAFTGEQLKDFNDLGSKAYADKYGKISAEIFA